MTKRCGFCDRCGAYTEFPAWKVSVCYPCELGMNSIAAALTPRWSRPMTAAEIRVAWRWTLIDHEPNPVVPHPNTRKPAGRMGGGLAGAATPTKPNPHPSSQR